MGSEVIPRWLIQRAEELSNFEYRGGPAPIRTVTPEQWHEYCHFIRLLWNLALLRIDKVLREIIFADEIDHV